MFLYVTLSSKNTKTTWNADPTWHRKKKHNVLRNRKHRTASSSASSSSSSSSAWGRFLRHASKRKGVTVEPGGFWRIKGRRSAASSALRWYRRYRRHFAFCGGNMATWQPSWPRQYIEEMYSPDIDCSWWFVSVLVHSCPFLSQWYQEWHQFCTYQTLLQCEAPR